MHIVVVGLGKQSTHLLSKTQHTRGIFGVYEVPIFEQLSMYEDANSTIISQFQQDWLRETGFVHIDFHNNMVYIGHNSSVDARYHPQDIQWKALFQHHFPTKLIERVIVTNIERLK